MPTTHLPPGFAMMVHLSPMGGPSIGGPSMAQGLGAPGLGGGPGGGPGGPLTNMMSLLNPMHPVGTPSATVNLGGGTTTNSFGVQTPVSAPATPAVPGPLTALLGNKT